MNAPTLIVGASVAGIRVAKQLRRNGHGEPITLLDAEPGLTYDKPALSKQAINTKAVEPLPLVTYDELDHLEIEYRPDTWANSLDMTSRHVITRRNEQFEFTRLVVATGASPRRLRALDHLRGVHYLRSWHDALELRASFESRPTVLVIGGGFIGLEVAAAARDRGLAVTVVEAAPRLVNRVMPREISDDLLRLHREHGVEIRCGRTVVAAYGDSHIAEVELDDGTRLTADIAVIGIGITPNTAWLSNTALSIDDGVLCTDQLQVVGTDDVWAAGDVARWHNPRYGALGRVEHWTNAHDHATVVAANIVAENPAFRRTCDSVPYVWSDQYDVRIQHAGRISPDSTTRRTTTRNGAGTFYSHELDGVLTAATAFNAPSDFLDARRQLQNSAISSMM